MSCAESFSSYAFRSIGFGERLLPKSDITLCDQIILIGSGMMWNVYFAVVAILFGFVFATMLAFARVNGPAYLRLPADFFVFVFRGSPLFIQFFFAYELFVQLPRVGVEIPLGFATLTASTSWLTKAWLGATVVLFLNTSAYSAEIFTGALKSIPRGDIEAADAFGMAGFKKFRRIVFPTMLRLAWPSYSNEAIFLFHSTALVFFSGFPAWRREADGLYYASYFAEATFNPFVPYPIIAVYFVFFTLLIVGFFGLVSKRLNRHMAEAPKVKFRLGSMLTR
ncbi:ABC transporter permease [Neptunicoccus cionae]|uniref:ABC transporter permease n=1 Tax=Neptunicoccus cionae TaxID=2035344 RepID=UPI000C765814|nr:ABC transporter permease subunit [Amylibacter cionae]PLS20623.1 amino acid ABC transporter permease [Amylibacter cionae]